MRPRAAPSRRLPPLPAFEYKRLLRLAAAVLFVAAVPLFLIATNVRWVINAPLLYSYGFDRHGSVERTGIEREELLSAARQIRDYFNNDEEFLTVSVIVGYSRVGSLFRTREVLHMRDVKDLVRGVYRVQELTAAYLAAFVAVGLAVRRRDFLPDLAGLLVKGGGATLALVVLAGLASLVGFDRLFLAFHLVSFANDLWQLDPSTDYLIAMFPQGFFFDATMWIAGLTIAEAAALVAAGIVLRRYTGKPRSATDSTSPE